MTWEDLPTDVSSYIGICYHFMTEKVEPRYIVLQYVPSPENMEYILTKGLGVQAHHKLAVIMGNEQGAGGSGAETC